MWQASAPTIRSGFDLGLVYSNIGLLSLGDTANGPNPSGYSSSVRFNTIEGSYQYRFTPALSARIAYIYTNHSCISSATGVNAGATYHQAMASIDYAFSKRPDVYLLGIFQQASGTDSLDLPAVASITNQPGAPHPAIDRLSYASVCGSGSSSRPASSTSEPWSARPRAASARRPAERTVEAVRTIKIRLNDKARSSNFIIRIAGTF